ncbi:MAG TPA: long-chain-fatty-acid--CoA ligase [Acidimicrobiales bacterium]|nr:long-chain-fatty-acid--CoA ligase [Acidimicrobiales bacterium]
MATVPDLVRNPAHRFPDRTCIIEGARSLTFAEVDRRADRLAAALAARGLRPGDRIALLALNELEYLEIQVGSQRAGTVLVPLNFRLTASEVAGILADCSARLLIHGPGLAAVAEDAAGWAGVADVVHLGPDGIGQPYDELLADGGQVPSEQMPSEGMQAASAALAADAAANILYTSGTTGRPKGAVLTNLGFYARSAALCLDVRAAPGSVFLQALPMFHIAANTAYSFTFCGSTIVLMREFSVDGLVDALHRYRATHLLLVPTMINAVNHHPGIDDHRFDHLQLVIYGASPIAPEVLKRAIDLFGCGFFQLYGMTETFACSVLRPEDHDPDGRPDLLASAGTDALTFETAVVDPDGRPCPAGVVGEIVARGPALMAEYFGAPDATAASLRDGWMHTGDLGYRDRSGYLFVTDRLKDMVITGGENVYPREVEDVLYAHPAVLEAAVIGLPDPRWGERVHAVVVLRPGAAVDEAALIAHCRASLTGYKCPRSVAFVDDLPKNATGKVLKKELRQAAAGSVTG